MRLISPQYVAPFVKANKNDRNDASAPHKVSGGWLGSTELDKLAAMRSNSSYSPLSKGLLNEAKSLSGKANGYILVN
ncbi:hypothetical protein [Caldimonas tepidiphila]|uniref:hypothetical protein n=1 Tax=Caldimonas tepidiphila TaxID=2315841 RepID=UPI003AF3F42E